MKVDHLAVCAGHLGEGVAWAEEALDQRIGAGGRHPRYGTHNALLGLSEGLYLEVIAIDPEAEPQDRPRWFDLDRFTGPPRLANWICRVPDLDAALADAPEGAGRAVDMERGDLRWRVAVPEDGGLPMQGGYPTLIEWQSPVPPGRSLPATGLRLTRLDIHHPEARALARLVDLPQVRFHRARSPRLAATFDGPGGGKRLG